MQTGARSQALWALARLTRRHGLSHSREFADGPADLHYPERTFLPEKSRSPLDYQSFDR